MSWLISSLHLTTQDFVIYPRIPRTLIHDISFPRSSKRLGTILLPLPTEEPKPKIVRLKRNLAPLGEIEHIAFGRVHLLASLVRDVEASVNNNLHLVVCVLVDKRSACTTRKRINCHCLFCVERKEGRLWSDLTYLSLDDRSRLKSALGDRCFRM